MHAKQSRLFVQALARMVGLTMLVWSCNHSLISLRDVWPTLMKCSNLSSVEVNDNEVFAPISEEEEESKAKLRIPNLKLRHVGRGNLPVLADPRLLRTSHLSFRPPSSPSSSSRQSSPSPAADVFPDASIAVPGKFVGALPFDSRRISH